MAAISYRIAGVSETTGRMPTVIVGWLTLAATFFCGQWLFGRRAGFFAAACLLTSYLFFRHSRLAETDAPAMFFVTLAVYALWRGVEGESGMGPTNSSRPYLFSARFVGWLHLGAASTALAILSKGPAGGYPLLFLLGLCGIRRSSAPLLRLLRSGALLTLATLALPWFLYIHHAVGYQQWKRETDELLGGEDHAAPIYQYLWQLLEAVGPWSLVMIGVLVAAIWHYRDRRVLGMLLWFFVVLLPLIFLPNKQFHYLMPLMPPVMILIGWWLDWVLPAWGMPQVNTVPLLDLTMILSFLGVPAVLVAARQMGGRIHHSDVAMSVALGAAAVIVVMIYLRLGRLAGLLTYFAAAAIIFVPLVGIWMPLQEGRDSRDFAREFRERWGGGPFCFYGRNYSLPLCFNLRQKLPQVLTSEALWQLGRAEPGLRVIIQTKSRFVPPPLSAGFVQEGPEVETPGQTFRVYRFQN
jgi:hypothetical protein